MPPTLIRYFNLPAPHHGRDRHSNIPLQVQPTKAAIVVTSDADPNEKQYFRYLRPSLSLSTRQEQHQ